MHVLNDTYSVRAKFKCKILGGLSYTKMKKAGGSKLYTILIYVYIYSKLWDHCSSGARNLHLQNVFICISLCGPWKKARVSAESCNQTGMSLSQALPHLALSLCRTLHSAPLPHLLSSPPRRRLHSSTAAASISTDPTFSLQIQQQKAATGGLRPPLLRSPTSLLRRCICLLCFCEGRWHPSPTGKIQCTTPSYRRSCSYT